MAFGAVEGGRNYPLLQLTRICRHLASGRRMDGGTSDWFNMRLDRLTTPQECRPRWVSDLVLAMIEGF